MAETTMTDGVSLIAAERERQKMQEGWTPDHDDAHDSGELARAAACYALPEGWRDMVSRLVELSENGGRDRRAFLPRVWPWASHWWKPTPDDRIRELVKAGALIAAEIDRLQRVPNG